MTIIAQLRFTELRRNLPEARRRNPVLKAAPGTGLGRVAATKQAAQVLDAREEPAYANDPTRSSFIESRRGAHGN